MFKPPLFKLHYRNSFLLFYIIFLIGCASPQEYEPTQVVTVQASTTVVATQLIEPAITETALTAPTATRMLTPTQTLLPTSTSAPATPTPTPTTTPAPTLSVQDEGLLLSELMTSNGGCKLPCWWGIVPGESDEQAVRDTFASRGIDDWIASFDGTYRLMNLGYPYSNSSYYASDVGLQLWVEDGLIQFIDVEGRRRPGEEGYLFTQDWQQYRPSEMFRQFGLPSYVALVAEIPADPGPHYYQLALSYPSVGIEIRYIIRPLTSSSGEDQVCAGFEHVDFIHLILYPPERVADVPIGIAPNHPDAYTSVSWETVTGKDLETFYQTFQAADASSCVDVATDPNMLP